MDIISSHVGINQSDLKTLCAYQLCGVKSLPFLLAHLVVPGLADSSCAVGEQQKGVTVRLSSQTDAPYIKKPELTPIEFQNLYTRYRIEAHAKRVESYDMAIASLVRLDMEMAMEMVWRNLPEPFGGAFSDDAKCYASDEREIDMKDHTRGPVVDSI
ncbi:hypothetical protein RhiLY_09860 [Ceratobasidium sp. AG-Ba]|nr:hypothetical protein RhiLY_09860 [Ceratobasidium sp. AG-Ba]